MGMFDGANNSSSFLEMLRRNPRGWGNLPAAPDAAPQAIFDEYGQPHHPATGQPLYDNSAPQKSAGDSLHDIAMSPVNMAMAPVHALTSLSELGGFPNPQNPQNQQDMSALVASMFGGNAMAPARGEAAVANAGSHLRPGLSLDGHKGPSSTNYQLMMHDQNIGRAYVREYPKTVQIGNFSIDPKFQRQGIGTEVQREIARLHGKPNVPDGTLSDIELARWKKNDPAAVADYVKPFEGASSSIPRTGSDAYWASQGGSVVPGTRAAAGELFSDTGKPSIFGSALAGAEGKSRGINPAIKLDAQQNDIFTGFDTIETGKPARVKGYHATHNDFTTFDPARIGDNSGELAGFSFAGDPDHAASYLKSSWRDHPSIIPADLSFSNPFVHDAGGRSWRNVNGNPVEPNSAWGEREALERGLISSGVSVTDAVKAAELRLGQPDGPRVFDTGIQPFSIHDLGLRARDAGHDGLIVRNVIDRGDNQMTPGNTITALSPGTVRSATTGETLFSDTGKPSTLGAALAVSQGDDPSSHAAIMDLLKKYGVTP